MSNVALCFVLRSKWRSLHDTSEVLRYAEENAVRFVDFKFTDLPGTWQHFTTP